MKVTDLKENECIHCETEEQANAICKLMHEAGLTWNSGKGYLLKYRYYNNICYYPKNGTHSDLSYAKGRNKTIYKAEQFLTQNIEIMSAVVNINPDTSEINITPKEGFEIDLEKSDLKNGKVVFKEVEKKYPSEFIYDFNRHGGTEEISFSKKYGYKLEILDTLLCVRDEYNRIDGFTEGFIFEEDNWCVSNWRNTLDVEFFRNENKIMHFGKEETAKLFLKNFEEQLEQIKEFL